MAMLLVPFRKMAFQSTVLPVMPGIVSRPTTIPPVGDLRDNYPETYGGVSRDDIWEGGGVIMETTKLLCVEKNIAFNGS